MSSSNVRRPTSRRGRDEIDELLGTEGFFDPQGAAVGSFGRSARKNLRSAIKQFALFLEHHITTSGEAGKELAQRLFGTQTPSSYSYLLVNRQAVDIKTMNKFARWLFKHARCLNNTSKRIEYKTADCCFSSIKNHIVKSSMYSEDKQLLTNEKIKPIRSGMEGLFRNRVMRENRSLSQSHKSAHDADTIRINMICLWSGDTIMAQMASYVEALFLFGGRSTEVAVMAFRRLSLYQPAEFADAGVGMDLIVNAKLWRIKTRAEQELSAFNHRDNFLRCFMFLLAHSMVLCQNPTEALFPAFLAKTQKKAESDDVAAAVEAEEEVEGAEIAENLAEMRAVLDGEDPDETSATDDCGLPRYYRDMLKRVQKAADDLNTFRNQQDIDDEDFLNSDEDEDDEPVERSQTDDATSVSSNTELNDFSQSVGSFSERLDSWLNGTFGSISFRIQQGLGAHSEKRHHVDTTLQDAGLNFVWISFRAGWVNKSLHSIFKYATENPTTDRQCARVISNWKTIDCRTNQYGGGRPPSLRSLEGKAPRGQPERFARALFNTFSGVRGANDPHLHFLLTATILLRLRDFLCFLSIHPKRKFGTTHRELFEKNRFLQLLSIAAYRAGIEDHQIQTLIEWSEIVEHDFVQRNYQFVAFSDLQRTGASREQELEIDTRSLGGYLQAFSREQSALRSECLQLRSTVSSLSAHCLHTMDLQRATQRELCLLRTQLSTMAQTQQALVQALTNRGSNGSSVAEALIDFGSPTSSTNPTEQQDSSTSQLPTSQRRQRPQDVALAMERKARLIPMTVGGERVQTVFQFWHSQGYYLLIGGDKNVRANFRKAVEYMTLFLPEHVPAPKPAFDSPEDEAWNQKVSELTKAAWSKILRWAESLPRKRDQNPPKVSEKVSQFCRFMYESDQSLLPDGPAGLSQFQPRNNKFRTKAQLIEAKKTNEAKPKPKRPRKRKVSTTDLPGQREQRELISEHATRMRGRSALGTGAPVQTHAQEDSPFFHHEKIPAQEARNNGIIDDMDGGEPVDTNQLRGYCNRTN